MSTWQRALGMEAQKVPGFPAASRDRPVPASPLPPSQGPSDPGRGRGAPAQEQALSQPLYLKALTVPLYQPVQAGCFQPHGHLVTARSCVHLDSTNIPLVLNPLVPAEGADQPRPLLQKQLGHGLTLNIVSTLPVLSPPSSCVNAGKSKKAGKHICKHCGRDCLKPSVLEKHIRSHTGERPFPCTTCGIAFKTQSNLYKHRRTQTHVNNARLPSDSDVSGVSEQNERSTESSTSSQGSKLLSDTSEDKGIQTKQPSSETCAGPDAKKLHELSLPATSSSSNASEYQETMNPSLSSKANQGGPEREPHSLASPGALPKGPCQRKKIQEQRTPTVNKHVQLQRQQATSSEKQWDYKPLDCKLKKCESTDSGYLSRSDSTEQQVASSSPLHSLCEHSTELENETAFGSPRCASGSSAKPEAAEKATALMLEKKRLEEHISKLISHNKSVVDDTQLDNVRPRKTVLSKQGSIDLPMPYTYKDSFHFDIRTCDVNRKKNLALCSAKSTFAPLEKCKPMFFHSVPTQFSTTIDTVPVTRSNSLPFVEGARMVHDKPGCSKPLSLTKQSANTGTAGLLPSNNLAANSVDFPNSHPRALVRQTAVDDLPLSNVVDHPPLSEELQGSKKLGAGEVITAKNKKHNQRKIKMFSQEKWQMYGDETFKKIYQKMKSSQNAKKMKQRGNKITDITSFTPDSKESASRTEITEERDGRSSVSDSHSSPVTAASNTGKSGACTDGNRVLQNESSEETADSVSYLMETSHSINTSAQTGRSRTSRELRGSDTETCTAGSSTVRAPGTCELSLQNPECQLSSHRRNDDSLPVQSSNWEKPSPGKESSTLELDYKSSSHNYRNHHGTDTGQHGLTPLWVHCKTRGTAGKSQNLPSERKKLKFEVEKTQNMISMSCPSPGSETNAVNEEERVHCSGTRCLATAAVTFSSKAEEQRLSTGFNESTGCSENVEYMKTIKLLPTALNYSDIDHLTHSTGISKASLVGFLGPGLRGSDCNSSALHNATDKDDKTCLVKTGAKAPLFNDNAVDVSSKINHLQSGHLAPIPQQNAFSPKYILKLPQDTRASNLPLLPRSEQKMTPCTSVTDTSTSPSCSSSSGSLRSHSSDVLWSPSQSEVRQKAGKGELRGNVHTNWKPPGFSSPVNSETTTTLTTVDNQNSRHQDMARDDWKNKQNKNKLNYQRQTEGKWMSVTTCSTQAPKKKICFTSVYTSSFFIAADIKDERNVLHHLCSGSDSLIKTSAPSKGAEPTVMGWDKGGSPRVPKDISPSPRDTQHSQSSTGDPTYLCRSFGTLYCHALAAHCKEFPVLPHQNWTCSSGTLTVPGTKGTFPSLSAEPRLTWCCLSRSLPLPAEQKGNADSAYSSLHTGGNGSSRECTLPKYDISIFKMKNLSKTGAYGLTNTSLKTLVSSFSKGQQMQELSSAATGGAFKNISEQKKKTVVFKKEKLSTNKPKRSHKQKKIKVTPKCHWPCRYRGRHVHGYAQIKMNRLSKRPCFPNRALEALRKGYSSQPPRSNKLKKCHSPQSKVQENYLHQQKDISYSTSDKPLCRRKKEGKSNSGISSHTENLNHVKQKDKMDKKDISGQIRERTGTHISAQNILAPLGMAPSSSSPAHTAVRQGSGDAAVCRRVTQPLALQRSRPGESRPSVRADPLAASFGSCPPDFTNAGAGDQLDSTDSEATAPLSFRPEPRRGQARSAEPGGRGFGRSEPAIRAPGREQPPAEESTQAPSKANSAPGSQPGCSRLFGSKVGSLPESVTKANREYTERANLSQKRPDLHGSADRNGSHLQPHGTATTTFRKPPVTLRSPEFRSYSATPPKTYKKRGLEMMRRQTRVEYDDTSSDDEDRLVIEI